MARVFTGPLFPVWFYLGENLIDFDALPRAKSAGIRMPEASLLSSDLADKAVHAAVAAIEVYNKPDFHYREEAFSLLITNAWELLLKAKWLSDHDEEISSLYQLEKDPNDPSSLRPRPNRSGNPMTVGLPRLAGKLKDDKNSGLQKPCFDNIIAMVEIRDNAAHFLNKDLHFGRRIQEIGTASLRNFLSLGAEWFQLDLSRYNFFLMPLSFYHGFEAITAATVSDYSEQMKRLLTYLDEVQRAQPEPSVSSENQGQSFALRLETQLVAGKGSDDASAFLWTDNLSARSLSLKEEDLRRIFRWTYQTLTNNLKKRYAGFLVNERYRDIRRLLEDDTTLVWTRFLNPDNPRSSKQRFYHPKIVLEFDRHYQRRLKDSTTTATKTED